MKAPNFRIYDPLKETRGDGYMHPEDQKAIANWQSVWREYRRKKAGAESVNTASQTEDAKNTPVATDDPPAPDTLENWRITLKILTYLLAFLLFVTAVTRLSAAAIKALYH